LDTQRTVLLQAPPGAGKSTVLPLALLNAPWLRGKRMLMLEPRRLAARTVAARMAQVMGERLGETVGYRVRFDNQVSARTRLEVLTEGILTRQLQRDPALDGVGLVIFDEFHERSLHADLALALCRDVQSVLRDDLRVLIMSATLDSAALLASFDEANAIPVITAEGRQHPVDVRYATRDSVAPITHLVADGVTRALNEHDGDVLAFLPGTADIQRAQALLAARHPAVLLRPLYGELPLDAQQAAIRPDSQGWRKIVLATSIAETSLTIEGIHVVVDSGFARVPRFDASTGLTRLETVRVTRDSADQRAGRAGRLGPGVCYRLWTREMHARLNAVRTPEIIEADLAPMRLELAQWGAKSVDAVQWITRPPIGAVRQAEQLLQQLGALHEAALTERGARMLALPTHPRLAHMLIEAQEQSHKQTFGRGLPALATDVAALLDERDSMPRSASADLTLRVEALRAWRHRRNSVPASDASATVLTRVERIAAQWRKQLRINLDDASPDPFAIGWLLAMAYPERIARASDNRLGRYRLSGGRSAQLRDDDPLQHLGWLAVAHLDAGSNVAGNSGRIFLAAPLHTDQLEPLATLHDVVGWDSKQGALMAQREKRVGELVIATSPIDQLPLEQRLRTLCAVVQAEGLGLFNWTDAARQLQARMQTLHIWHGSAGEDAWPNVSDETLLTHVDVWLVPWLEHVFKRTDFMRLDMVAMLRAQLTPRQLAQLDLLAPTHVDVPSGSRIRLNYSADGALPVLAVKLQEMFGLADTPTVNNGRTRVLLHLLSPAQRPIQVTQDLRSFWQNAYPEVRKELRGRYNKHPWPEDPWNAQPTRKTVRANKK
jgi:ATP-dependent helicase HrpB